LDLAQHPDFYDSRKRSIKLPLTRWDMGDYLGAAPETIIRAFAKMERQKLLRRGLSDLLDVDLEGLRRLIAGRRRSP
jgi:CRP-like cAMP-binding protein